MANKRALDVALQPDSPRVLVVEDDDYHRRLLSYVLEEGGCTVAEAIDGASAVEQARSNTPDLIISDLLMAGMDGYSLLKACKGDPELAPIPFIVFSGAFTDQDSISLALDMGADAFLEKPVSLKDFKAVVLESLYAREARDEIQVGAQLEADGLDGRLAAVVGKRVTSMAGGEIFSALATPLAQERKRGLNTDSTAEVDTLSGVDIDQTPAYTHAAQMLDAVPSAIAFIGADGAVSAVNRAWLQLAGEYPDSEILKSTVGSNLYQSCNQETGCAETPAMEIARCVRAVLGGNPRGHELEYRTRSSDGSHRFRVSITHAELADKPAACLVMANAASGSLLQELADKQASRLESAMRVNSSALFTMIMEDKEWRLEWASDNIETLMGYPLGDDNNMLAWLDKIHPEDLNDEVEFLETLRREGEAQSQFRFRHSSGEWRSIHNHMVKLGTTDSGGIEVMGAWTDITDRDAGRFALGRTEPLFQATFSQAALGFAMVNIDGTLLDVNLVFSRMLGYTTSELRGKPMSSLIYPDDLVTKQELTEHLLQGDIPSYSLELRFQHKSGRTLWVRLGSNAIRGAENEPLCLVKYMEDITEARKASESMRSLSRAVEQSSEGIAICDAHSRIEYVNAQFEKITGERSHDITGTMPRILIPELVPQELVDEMYAELRAGRSWSGELLTQRKNGERYYASSRISPIRNESGAVVNFLCSIKDVSASRMAADELESYRTQLEELVEHRTIELMQARQVAESANAAKSEFLASMSHEIRTPMNGVLGMAELLTRSNLDPYQLEMVETIVASGSSLLQIVNDVLDISRIEANLLTLESEAVSLASTVQSVTDLMAGTALAKNIDLSVFIDPALPGVIVVDEFRIKQVLYNLVGNALKFTEREGSNRGRVRVRILKQDSVEERWILQVKDNGIGIDESRVDELFQPYVQASGATTKRFGGTGLGLAITKQIVDRMGGSISVQSEIGQGTTFTLEFPLQYPLPDAGPQLSSELAGLHCIVLEHESIDTWGIRKYLASAGAEVDLLDATGWADVRSNLLAETIVVRVVEQGTPAVPDDHKGPQVLILRGRRQQSRVRSDKACFIDSASLTRSTLLAALAVLSNRSLSELPLLPGERVLPRDATEAEFRRRSRILVAEDDKISRLVIKRQLELLDYSAEFVADGEAALNLWRQGNFSLVLTDLHMPRMDGHELVAAIRSEEELAGGPHIPVIVLSANALSSERDQATLYGFDGYLTKPVQLHRLNEALSQHLDAAMKGAGPALLPAAGEVDDENCEFRVLRDFVGDNDEVVADFLRLFQRTAVQAMEELRSARESEDLAGLAAVAHKLKSSARSVGANALADLCVAEEQNCSAGDVAGSYLIVDKIAEALDEFNRKIVCYLAIPVVS